MNLLAKLMVLLHQFLFNLAIAATHKINAAGESKVAYGPATNRDGYVMVMERFLHDLH